MSYSCITYNNNKNGNKNSNNINNNNNNKRLWETLDSYGMRGSARW